MFFAQILTKKAALVQYLSMYVFWRLDNTAPWPITKSVLTYKYVIDTYIKNIKRNKTKKTQDDDDDAGGSDGNDTWTKTNQTFEKHYWNK
jgi:hypothetical protein